MSRSADKQGTGVTGASVSPQHHVGVFYRVTSLFFLSQPSVMSLECQGVRSTVITPAPSGEARQSTFPSEADLCYFFSRYPTPVESLLFTEDSRWLAAGRADGSIDVYNVASHQLFMSLPGGENASARCLGFLPKLSEKASGDIFDYRFFSTGLHGIISEWDFSTQTTRFAIPSLGGAVFALCVDKSNRLLITANDDGSVRFFKTYVQDVLSSNPGEELDRPSQETSLPELEETLVYWKSLTRHDGRLLSVCLYDGQKVFAGTADSRIIGWNWTTGVSYVNVTIDKSLGSSRKSLEKVFSGATTSGKNDTLVWSLVPLPSHGLLASGDSIGTVHLWTADTLTSVATFHCHQADILGLAVCPVTGNTLFSVGLDGKMCIFNVITSGEEKKKEWILAGCRHPHVSDIHAIDVAKSGLLATGSSDTVIALIDSVLSSSTRKQYLPSSSATLSTSWIHCCESMKLVLTVDLSCLTVWCLLEDENTAKTLNPVKTLLFHINDGEQGWLGVRCAAIDSDGSLFAVSNDFGTRLYTFNIHQLEISAFELKKLRSKVCTALHFFTKDSSHFLLTATVKDLGHSNGDISLLVWNMKTKDLMASVSKLPSALLSIRVSPDGEWCATRSVKGLVEIYSLRQLKLQKYQDIPSFSRIDHVLYERAYVPLMETKKEAFIPLYHKASAFVFSPDSKYLAIFSFMSKYFMIFDIGGRCCVTSDHIAPRQGIQTTDPIIFRIKELEGTSEDEIGCVLWRTRLSSLGSMDPMEDPHEKREVHTFLIQTRKCLITRDFQILKDQYPATHDATHSTHSPLTPAKVSPKEKRRKLNSVEDNSDVEEEKKQNKKKKKKKWSCCKLYKPSQGFQFLNVFLLPTPAKVEDEQCNTKKNTERLLIFAQAKDIPVEMLSPAFERKRYAT